MAGEQRKEQGHLSVEVRRVAEKLQELVDRKYRGKVQVVFHPAGVVKGVEIIEFFHAKGEHHNGE